MRAIRARCDMRRKEASLLPGTSAIEAEADIGNRMTIELADETIGHGSGEIEGRQRTGIEMQPAASGCEAFGSGIERVCSGGDRTAENRQFEHGHRPSRKGLADSFRHDRCAER